MRDETLAKFLGATHIIDRKAGVFAEVKKFTDKLTVIACDAIS